MKFPEQYRDVNGGLARHKAGDDFGWFVIPASAAARRPLTLRCMASPGFDGLPWEHVSVSTAARCPTWEEMCFVKNLFWSEDECVVQFHPPKSDYVNVHPNCLHLWRWKEGNFPRPPAIAVG